MGKYLFKVSISETRSNSRHASAVPFTTCAVKTVQRLTNYRQYKRLNKPK